MHPSSNKPENCRPSADILGSHLPDLSQFDLKIGPPVTPVLETIHTNLDFSATFQFQARSPCRTNKQKGDRQTNQQMGKTCSE